MGQHDAAQPSTGEIQTTPSGHLKVVRDPAYLRQMLLLILAASFFDGYDEGILTLVPTNIQDTFGLTVAGLAWMRFFIQLGAVIAFAVAASADWFGRRPILLWSVVGYTIFTGLTAFAWTVVIFTILQFMAKIFLASEYAVAVTMISEEYPPERRGRALGVFSLMQAAGILLVPIVALTPLFNTPLEWRVLYLIGLVPLVFLIFLRRNIEETLLFRHRRKFETDEGRKRQVAIWEPWRQPHRYFMIVLAAVTFLRAFPVFAATAWWVWYAEREAGLPQEQIFVFFIIAFALGIGGYYTCGRLIDIIGRKPTIVTFALIAWIAGTVLFQSRTAWMQAVALVFAVFFGLGTAVGLNAFYTELFPTRLRASAASWARNAFEIPGIILGPLVVGLLGDHGTGAIGAVGDSATITLGVLPVLAILVWRYLPETKGRKLELLDEHDEKRQHAEAEGVVGGPAPEPAETGEQIDGPTGEQA